MYHITARDLGFTFPADKEPISVSKNHFPSMFIGIIFNEWESTQIMAFGIHNLTTIVRTDRFPQVFGKKDIKNKPLIFRRFESLDKQGEFDYISADVSKIWSPRYGKMICRSHPKHGLTSKFAPIGKVYNETFCLLPIFKEYYGKSLIEHLKDEKSKPIFKENK